MKKRKENCVVGGKVVHLEKGHHIILYSSRIIQVSYVSCGSLGIYPLSKLASPFGRSGDIFGSSRYAFLCGVRPLGRRARKKGQEEGGKVVVVCINGDRYNTTSV